MEFRTFFKNWLINTYTIKPGVSASSELLLEDDDLLDFGTFALFFSLFGAFHWISYEISHQTIRKITQIKVHDISYNLLSQFSSVLSVIHFFSYA